MPSPYVSKVRLKAKHEIHGGIIGAPVDSVSTGALVVGYLKGSPPSSNPSFTPVGRIISIIGRPESATPYFSATVRGIPAPEPSASLPTPAESCRRVTASSCSR
jgi:hypothetical protein